MMVSDPAEAVHEAFRVDLEMIGDYRVAEFVGGMDWRAPARRLTPKSLACLHHLDRAAGMSGQREKPLLQLLAGHGHRLCWGQTYTAEDFGQHFLDNYGWVELIGTRGHFVSDTIAAGFLVLGPDIVYPDHRHIAEELYLPLTGGTEWRMDEGSFVARAAGDVIHHPSNVAHAMRTGAEPLVALYLWRGGPLAQKSEIGSAPR